MSQRKDVRFDNQGYVPGPKVRLGTKSESAEATSEACSYDLSNTLFAIKELQDAFSSTQKKIDSYGRGVLPTTSVAVNLRPADIPDVLDVRPDSRQLDITRATWLAPGTPTKPTREVDHDSGDSARTYSLRQTPPTSFKFLDAVMPEVPPTPHMARHILAGLPRDLAASWVTVRPVDSAPMSPFRPPRGDLATSRSADDFVTNRHGFESELSNPTAAQNVLQSRSEQTFDRPTIVRKSIRLSHELLDNVGAGGDAGYGPVLVRKSMKLTDVATRDASSTETKPRATTRKSVKMAGSRSREEAKIVRKKTVIPPSSVMTNYPGFCDTRDVDKQTIRSKSKETLDRVRLTSESRDSPKRKSITAPNHQEQGKKMAKVESEYGVRKKHTITPTTWKEERKELDDRAKAIEKQARKERKMKEKESQGDRPRSASPSSSSSSKVTKDVGVEVKKTPVKKPKPSLMEERRREKSPPKVRHYDVKETQEYMNKQKALRQKELDAAKQKKKQEMELRKIKLKALHEKQLKLAAVSVKKRPSSKADVAVNVDHVPIKNTNVETGSIRLSTIAPLVNNDILPTRLEASAPPVLRPPAANLPLEDSDIDKRFRAMTDNLNRDLWKTKLFLDKPGQGSGIVLSHSPPEKLAKEPMRMPVASSRSEVLHKNENKKKVVNDTEADLIERGSNIMKEFYAELQKFETNAEKLKNRELSSQFELMHNNDLSLRPLSDKPANRNAQKNTASTSQVPSNIHLRNNQGNLSKNAQQALDYMAHRRLVAGVTKIQAAYRGWLVRRRGKMLALTDDNDYCLVTDPNYSVGSDYDGKVDLETKIRDELKKDHKFNAKYLKKSQTKKKEEVLPEGLNSINNWLQAQLTPNPNNFISAVRQKLQLFQDQKEAETLIPPSTDALHSNKDSFHSVSYKTANNILANNPMLLSTNTVPIIHQRTSLRDNGDTVASSLKSSAFESLSTPITSSHLKVSSASSKSRATEDLSNVRRLSSHQKLNTPDVGLVVKKRASFLESRSEGIITLSPQKSRQRRRHLAAQRLQVTTSEDDAYNKLTVTVLPTKQVLSSDVTDLADSKRSDLRDKLQQPQPVTVDGRGDAKSYNKPLSPVRVSMLPPKALHLQFQAELNLLESVDESRRQLAEAENLRAVTLAQQGTSSLAQALQQSQSQAQQDELENRRFEAVLERERLEMQRFFQEALKTRDSLKLIALSELPSREASELPSRSSSKHPEIALTPSSSVPEVLESNVESALEPESSVNASMSEHVMNTSEHIVDAITSDIVSDQDISSLDITQKIRYLLPNLALSPAKSETTDASFDDRSRPVNTSMMKFSQHLLEQLIKDEERRAQQERSLLKLQDKALTEKTKAEIAWLEVQKRELLEKGKENQVSGIKKKQRGIILKLQKDKEDFARMRERQKLAAHERKVTLLRQKEKLNMELSSRRGEHKLKQPQLFPKQGSKDHSLRLKEILSEKSSLKSADSISSLASTPLGEQHSEIPEELLQDSESQSSIMTNVSALLVDPRKEKEIKCLEEQVLEGLKKLDKNKPYLNEETKKLQLRRESVEELLAKRKQMEEEERSVQELESEELALTSSVAAKKFITVRDSCTSPLQTTEEGTKSAISEHIVNSESSLVPPESVPESIVSRQTEVQATADVSTSASGVADAYKNDSFESVESSTNLESNAVKPAEPKENPAIQRHKSIPVIPLKAPLSPIGTVKAKRRYSSGSDDSVVYSQTETTSEQSDAEGRITALNEQLKRRMVEAERLRREQKRINRERLNSKEQCLLKQIQEYDKIIAQAKQDIENERELGHLNTSVVRPKIKQPRVAERKDPNKPLSFIVRNLNQDFSLAALDSEGMNSFISKEKDTRLSEPVAAVVSTVAIDIAVSNSFLREHLMPGNAEEQKESDITDKSSNDASSIISEHIEDALSEGQVSEAQESSGFLLSGDGNQKSNSDESSIETTIHSQALSAKSDPETKQSVELQASARDNEDEKLEELIEKHSQRDSIRTQVEDEVASIPSSSEADISHGVVEDVDDSVGKTSEVIKIFLGEKLENQKERKRIFFEPDQSVISEGPLDETLPQDVSLDKLPLNQTFTLDQSKDSSKNDNNASADRLTDGILRQLLRECTGFKRRVKSAEVTEESISELLESRNNKTNDSLSSQEEESLNSKDLNATYCVPDRDDDLLNKSLELADTLLGEYLRESTDHILNINRRVAVPSSTDSSVRRRVHEILAESASPSSIRATSRPQDLMISTYDVLTPDDESPMTTPTVHSSENSFDKDTLEAPPSSPRDFDAGLKVDLGVALSSAGDSDHEGFTQEWFDEDFGLAHTRREAEELRLQQLQIEQEIQQLEQAQGQISYTIHGYPFREIPNKPPPPYTPPGQSPSPRSKQQELRRRQLKAVPASREEISTLTASATRHLFSAITQGSDLDIVKPPQQFTEPETNDSRRVFKTFVFDLTKEIVKDAYEWEASTWKPAWEKPTCSNKSRKLVPRSLEMLQDIVQRKIFLYLGFVQKSGKDNMIMSGCRKKKDTVDELLMREAHEEEESWTNYDVDEATLKNDITMTILNSLLDDTVQVFQAIHERRKQKAIRQSSVIC